MSRHQLPSMFIPLPPFNDENMKCAHQTKTREAKGASECLDCGMRFQWTMDADGNSDHPPLDIVSTPAP